MTRKEMIKEIRNRFESAEALWGGSDYSPRVTTTVFYISALLKVKESPFKSVTTHLEIVAFLDAKIDEAFGKLEDGEAEQVFRMSEEMGLA